MDCHKQFSHTLTHACIDEPPHQNITHTQTLMQQQALTEANSIAEKETIITNSYVRIHLTDNLRTFPANTKAEIAQLVLGDLNGPYCILFS